MTNTQEYWNNINVMVVKKEFSTVGESEDWLKYRFSLYPFFREYMDLWGKHEGKIILDYGCGPGNDLVGFAEYSGAKKVIGIDVAKNALVMAKNRMKLHQITEEKFDLMPVEDSLDISIPLPDNSVDYFQSSGVLHHTIYYQKILKELYRILKVGCTARIMVYNRDSLWYNLYVGYIVKVINGQHKNLKAWQIAGSTTDGPNCPVSIFFYPGDFAEDCKNAGFQVDYLGGYFAQQEINFMNQYGLNHGPNTSLDIEHREFFNKLTMNGSFPVCNGKTVGVGGCYLLRKT
jgi:SAM-dependent methyltransferase